MKKLLILFAVLISIHASGQKTVMDRIKNADTIVYIGPEPFDIFNYIPTIGLSDEELIWIRACLGPTETIYGLPWQTKEQQQWDLFDEAAWNCVEEKRRLWLSSLWDIPQKAFTPQHVIFPADLDTVYDPSEVVIKKLLYYYDEYLLHYKTPNFQGFMTFLRTKI